MNGALDQKMIGETKVFLAFSVQVGVLDTYTSSRLP